LGSVKTFGPRNVGLGPAARAQTKKKKEVRSVLDTGRSRFYSCFPFSRVKAGIYQINVIKIRS